MLDFLIKVFCQIQMAAKIQKVLDILQSFPLIVIEGGLEGVLGIGWCSTLVLPVSVKGEAQALIGTGEKIQDGLQSVLGVC